MKDYGQLAEEVLDTINSVRANPSSIIPELKDMSTKFKGTLYNDYLRTTEGAKPVLEAIDFLKTQKPVPPIKAHDGLQRVAEDFAKELGETGAFSHTDRNGQGPSDRITKLVNWTGSMNEALSVGAETAKDIVNSWIIDDGTSSRAHRKALFSPTSNLAGVGCAAHPKFKTVTVLDTIGAVSGESVSPGQPIPSTTSGTSAKPSTSASSTKAPATGSTSASTKPSGTAASGATGPGGLPSDYKKFSQGVLDRVNAVRGNPKLIIPQLTEMTKKFKGTVYNDTLMTTEGAPAVQEAIEFLKKQPSVPPIKAHDGLMKVAENFANELCETGNFSHTNKKGQGSADRISEVVNWTGKMNESISLGSQSPEDIVNSWIIDDGNASRGHRENVFAKTSKLGGVGCGTHSGSKVLAVFDTIEAVA